MISVAEARERILKALSPTTTELVGLVNALHRIAAKSLTAQLNNPPADVSAMDGYALRHDDTHSEAKLHIVGEAPAGHPFHGQLHKGEALRIFTGSFIPQGADCVVMQEDVTATSDTIILIKSYPKGQHVRPQGQDFTKGEIILHAGEKLSARHIALCSAANHTWVEVYRKPKIALLSTGDELVLPGSNVAEGSIVNSNLPMLASFIQAAGGEAIMLPPVRDDMAALADMGKQLSAIDLFVTLGGASVGQYDLVQSAMKGIGLEVDFWKIAMRPGKPLIFGKIGTTPMLGLPGNPVSAYVCALNFLLPALNKLQGDTRPFHIEEKGHLLEDIPSNPFPLRQHLRAKLTIGEDGLWETAPYTEQDSSMLKILKESQALIVREPHEAGLKKGDMCTFIRLIH